mmetsp:Transcript_3540/g.8454  ORF Transcript_3540/g.8454 Transcript_3540/m.8454 type:complete len:222 (-) Transcript_3540:777-1442(-)
MLWLNLRLWHLLLHYINVVVGMDHNSLQEPLVLAEKGRPLGPGRFGNVLHGKMSPDVAHSPENGSLFQNQLDEFPGRTDRPTSIVEDRSTVIIPHQKGAVTIAPHQKFHNIQTALAAGQVQNGLTKAVAGIHGSPSRFLVGSNPLERDHVPPANCCKKLDVLVSFHSLRRCLQKLDFLIGTFVLLYADGIKNGNIPFFQEQLPVIGRLCENRWTWGFHCRR